MFAQVMGIQAGGSGHSRPAAPSARSEDSKEARRLRTTPCEAGRRGACAGLVAEGRWGRASSTTQAAAAATMQAMSSRGLCPTRMTAGRHRPARYL
jgi:hypothetical protein